MLDLTIHKTGMGQCALSGKETDGVTVTFKDGTTKETFLSWKAFRQMLEMKTGVARSTSTGSGTSSGRLDGSGTTVSRNEAHTVSEKK
jgi:hypothetical protein